MRSKWLQQGAIVAALVEAAACDTMSDPTASPPASPGGGAAAAMWEEANRTCACATIDGALGWRLPSRIELASLADWTTINPSIDTAAFPDTPSESFWSATVLSSDPMLAYLVYFANGHT